MHELQPNIKNVFYSDMDFKVVTSNHPNADLILMCRYNESREFETESS